MIEVGVQIVKHLASNAQKEELRKICSDSGQIVLHSSYPTVNVSQIQYDKFVFMLSTKKSVKAMYKSIVHALLPDWSVWASNNAEAMREKYSSILNAALGKYSFLN